MLFAGMGGSTVSGIDLIHQDQYGVPAQVETEQTDGGDPEACRHYDLPADQLTLVSLQGYLRTNSVAVSNARNDDALGAGVPGKGPMQEGNRSTKGEIQIAREHHSCDQEVEANNARAGWDDLIIGPSKADDPPLMYPRIPQEALRIAIEKGLLSYDMISLEDIQDKSKSDLIGKALAVFQILYFLLELLVRPARKLPITLLELGVSGFVMCSVATYLFAMQKPKSVNTTVVMRVFGSDGIPARLLQLSAKYGNAESHVTPVDPFSNLGFRNKQGTGPMDIGATIIMSVLLGATHLAGWNFTFPSQADLMLYRVAAVASTAALAVVFPCWAIWFALGEVLNISDDVNFILSFLPVGLYTLARIILIVEMFRCLFYLPPEAFLTTWTTNIPHIG